VRVVLVRPDSGSRFQINPPLSLGYLSAALKANGVHDVDLLDCTLEGLDPFAAAVKVLNMRADIVGIQVYHLSQFWTKYFVHFCRTLRPPYGPMTVCGGPGVSAFPQAERNRIECDVVIVGEGEDEFANLVFHPEDGPAVRYAEAMDVNKYPIPDWGLLRPAKYFKHLQPLTFPLRGKRPAPIVTSRGCPYRCAFCAAHVVHGRRVRLRDADNVLQEMQQLRDIYGVDEIFFSDDNILWDAERAKKIFLGAASLGLWWRAPNGIRYESADGDMARHLCGGYYVGMGIESGSRKMRDAIHKYIDVPRMKRVVRLLRGNGITVSGFYISGLPGETWRDRFASVLSAWHIGFDRIQVSPFTPLPGSELSESTPRNNRMWNMFQTLVFYIHPRIVWSLIRNIRWVQVKTFWRHPQVRLWTWRSR